MFLQSNELKININILIICRAVNRDIWMGGLTRGLRQYCGFTKINLKTPKNITKEMYVVYYCMCRNAIHSICA